MTPPDDQVPCPCESGKAYGQCCAPRHRGQAAASTAEVLMRSRYSAYAVGDEDYLLETWHPSTRPKQLGLDQPPHAQWLGLKVLATDAGARDDDNGTVEFIARYKVGGKAHRLHEVSRFVREQGCWYYVDGDVAGAGD